MRRAALPSWFKKLSRDHAGVAAVEFALIAPMMVLVLFGIVEVSELLKANRRVETVAASLSDVVARDTIVDGNDLSDLWRAIDPLMFPSPTAPAQARITSVLIDKDGKATVGWSAGHNGFSGLAPGAAFTLPADMRVPLTSVIVAEVRYTYTPAINVVLGNTIAMAHTEFRRPRVVDPITFDPR